MSRLLTVAEVGARMRLEPYTVRERIRNGVLPAIREGGRLLVNEGDLEAYLESKVSGPSTAPRRRKRRGERTS